MITVRPQEGITVSAVMILPIAIFILMNIFLLGMGIYYAYMYYIHIFKSEERMLRITDIDIHRNRNGSRYYYIVGELEDMPGEQLRSLDSFPLTGRYHYEGDVIPVRYAGTKRFAVDPQKLLRNVILMFVLSAVLIFMQSRFH